MILRCINDPLLSVYVNYYQKATTHNKNFHDRKPKLR